MNTIMDQYTKETREKFVKLEKENKEKSSGK